VDHPEWLDLSPAAELCCEAQQGDAFANPARPGRHEQGVADRTRSVPLG